MNPITLFFTYIAAFLILYLALSILCILQRRKTKIGLGGGIDAKEHAGLNRAIAAHSNFSQYVPIILVSCLFLKEKVDIELINGVLGLTLLGRISHAYGISQIQEKLIFRQMGMMMTFFAMIILVILAII